MSEEHGSTLVDDAQTAAGQHDRQTAAVSWDDVSQCDRQPQVLGGGGGGILSSISSIFPHPSSALSGRGHSPSERASREGYSEPELPSFNNTSCFTA